MSFMGELSDIGVSDLLYLLALRNQTGKLAISANGDEVNLFLANGQLVVVTSSNMALRLGRMLVRMGFLPPEKLREALQVQEHLTQSQPLGSILLRHGYVTEEQLSRCVEEQCIEILSRVISAEKGVFVYHEGITVSAQTEIVPLNADRIVIEATSRTDELSTLRVLLPDEDAPIMLASEVQIEADALSDAEVFIVATLQAGASSLRELATRLAMDEAALLRTVMNMRERGLLVAGESHVQDSIASQIDSRLTPSGR